MEEQKETSTETKQEPKQESKSETITIKKDALWKYSTFVLLAIVVIGAIAMFTGDNGAPNVAGAVVGAPGAAPTAPTPTPTPAAVNVQLSDDDNYIKGDKNSKAFIIEYSDFECPFCSRAHDDALSQIKSDYDDKDVAIIYRHFPLSFHPQAQKAGEAAECAGDQGKFIEMHDMLFESGVQGGVDSFKGYAADIGLDTGKFDKCLDSGETASRVSADFQQGQKDGVRGTPGFLVGNADSGYSSISGAQPFTAFKGPIDALL